MLKRLKITNVALIKQANVRFDEKLNIISGETGAGKSVLLNCINLIMGAKADKFLIKNGEDFLKVEAEFEINETPEILKVFNELDLEFDNFIIITRKINLDGKNEVKINGENVPLNYVKVLSKCLIDMHSQNENLTLLNADNQLKLLDDFINFNFEEISLLHKQLKTIEEEINKLDKDEETRNRELDLISFQIKEIEDAKISKSEEEDLKNELIVLKNYEKINNSLTNLKQYFTYNSENLFSILKKCENEILNLSKFDDKCSSLTDRLNNASFEINDIYDELLKNFDYEFDENRYNEIDERLDLYKNLHKKYGLSYEDIINYYNKILKQKEILVNYQEELDSLNKTKKEVVLKAYNECKKLTKERQNIAKILEEKIICELKELSMKNAKINFSFNEYNEENFAEIFSKKGADKVTILFSANLGEDVKPLNLVASGGEISRLMLAIKTIVSEKENSISMIFDELDTGISGEASIATSKKLAKISKNHQIIAISHLFQICAMADKNILVKKLEEDGKTTSYVAELDGKDAINELCRFLAVDKVTETSLLHAQEVKKYCDDYKKLI